MAVQSGISARGLGGGVLVAAVALLVGACASPVPMPTPAATRTADTQASPSPRSHFPQPRERARATGGEAEQRLRECEPAGEVALASRQDAQPAVAGLVELEIVGQLGGRPHATVFAGDSLYVGVGPRVVVFETEPTWRRAGQSDLLPGIVTGLAVKDGLVVAALGDAGIAILEARSDRLMLSGSLELPGPAHGAAIGRGIAHVAAGTAGLQLVDLTDPTRPKSLGAALDDYDIRGVAIGGGGMALAAAGSDGLLVADVSAPGATALLGRLYTGGYAFAVQLVGSTAYLADGWGGLRTIDASDASKPRELGTLPTAGWTWQVAVDDGIAYAAAGSQGLVVADVSRPEEPAMLGIAPLSGGQAVQVAVRDDVAFVVDPFEGVQIVDVTSAASPQQIGTWQPLLEGWGVALSGDLAYVAAGRAGLRAVDVSEPARPRDVDALPTVATANAVTAVEMNVLVSTVPDAASDVVPALIDVDASDHDLLRPRSAYGQLGRIATPPGPARGLARSGSVSVYGIEHGIMIVDSATTVCELAFVQTEQAGFAFVGLATAVAVNGDLAFVGISGSWPHHVLALDISDPREPRVVSSFVAPAQTGALANGRWLYTVGYGPEDLSHALYVFDVADPSRPRQVGSLELPAEPRGLSAQTMTFAAGHVFVAAAEGGLLAIDVSSPARPRLAARLAVPGYALSVSAAGDYLYVGSSEAGLLVVDVGADRGSAPPKQLPSTSGWSGIAAPIDRPAVAIAPARAAAAAPGCVVTTTADDGPGSLRDCLDRVKRGDAVTFDPELFSPERPATIQLRSGLNWGVAGITVDGAGGVILDGGGTVETSFVLKEKCCVTIRGLQVEGFLIGLWVISDGNTIEDNVIAGNVNFDLYLHGASGNRIVGNYVSVEATGMALAYDPRSANPPFDLDSGSAMNLIEGNLFGGGVYVADQGSYNNSFVGNRFGVNARDRPLPCAICELVLDEPFNRLGGSLPGEENLIYWRLLAQPGNVQLNNEIINGL